MQNNRFFRLQINEGIDFFKLPIIFDDRFFFVPIFRFDYFKKLVSKLVDPKVNELSKSIDSVENYDSIAEIFAIAGKFFETKKLLSPSFSVFKCLLKTLSFTNSLSRNTKGKKMRYFSTSRTIIDYKSIILEIAFFRNRFF
jgi:hypothetical protein